MARLGFRIESALDELERDGTLSNVQRAVVSERVGRAVRAGLGFDLVAIVATLGAVLVAAGVLYLLGYHWGDFSKGGKLALVFGIWAAVHAGGYALLERRPFVGRALTLVGVLAFGGATSLVAQMYHLSARYPWSVLAWWVLAIPIALVTRSRAVLVAVVGVALFWCMWHVGVWIEELPGAHDREGVASIAVVVLAACAALLALAALAERSRFEAFAAILCAPVLPLLFLAPLVLAFHPPWSRTETAVDLVAVLVPATIGVVAAALVLGTASARRGVRAALEGWIVLGVALLLAACALLAPVAVPAVANLAYFAGALFVVTLGVRAARPVLVNAGVLAFVVGAIIRYFEYLFSRLEGAYAFLATGAILLLGAFVFENRRRALKRRLAEGAR